MDVILDFMNGNMMQAATSFVVICFIILEISKSIKEGKSVLRIKTGSDQDKEEMNQKFKSIEKNINELTEHNSKQDLKIDKLEMKIDKLIDDGNRRTVGTYRTQLWDMHKKLMAQKYVTKEDLTTFTEAGKIYESAGGNDVYHSKLLPEVLSLPTK